MTPKQRLHAHLAEHHHRRAPVVAARWTLDELVRWHTREHHQFGGQDHYHEGGRGQADDRPAGWRTGGDVVLREGT